MVIGCESQNQDKIANLINMVKFPLHIWGLYFIFQAFF